MLVFSFAVIGCDNGKNDDNGCCTDTNTTALEGSLNKDNV
jgi:hypothetical protein